MGEKKGIGSQLVGAELIETNSNGLYLAGAKNPTF